MGEEIGVDVSLLKVRRLSTCGKLNVVLPELLNFKSGITCEISCMFKAVN